jgi:regulator of replication initiation timing
MEEEIKKLLERINDLESSNLYLKTEIKSLKFTVKRKEEERMALFNDNERLRDALNL